MVVEAILSRRTSPSSACVDSPFFSTIVLSKSWPVSLGKPEVF